MNIKNHKVGDIVYYYDRVDQTDHYGIVADSTDYPPWFLGNKQYRIRLFKPIKPFDFVWVDEEILVALIENTNE